MDSGKSGRVLDVEVARAHVDDDLQLLSELASMFVQDYSRLIGDARNAILKNDYSELERAAHTLKGRLAFFGIKLLHQELLDLETMGRTNDLSRADQALTEIDNRMQSILPEFEPLIMEQHR